MGFLVFDYYGAWALAVNKPITATCLNAPSCFPTTFGVPSGNWYTSQGLNIDNGDLFHFTGNPIVTAIAFSGFETRGKPFGLAISGMGRLDNAPVYFYSTTGFLGVITTTPTIQWSPGDIIAAPLTNNILTQMYFAV
ncbi:MAG: hypothetical protein KF722_07790 [Nitrospira sp.]|nr:hypothetical protein [Nitrospira sp.]